MGRWDDRILELLNEEGPMNVTSVYEHPAIFYESNSSVSRRLNELCEHGLVERISAGVYQISEEGTAYLNEEYDADQGVYLDNSEEDSSISASEGESA